MPRPGSERVRQTLFQLFTHLKPALQRGPDVARLSASHYPRSTSFLAIFGSLYGFLRLYLYGWQPALPRTWTAWVTLLIALPIFATVQFISLLVSNSSPLPRSKTRRGRERYELLGTVPTEDGNVGSEDEIEDSCRHTAETRIPRSSALVWYTQLLVYATIALVGLHEWAYENEGDIRFRPALQRVLADPHSHPTGLMRGEKIFIAAAFHQNEAVIPYWTRTILDTIPYLGTDNVFVSIVENYSKDRSPQLLRDFAQELNRRGVRNRVLVQDETVKKPPQLEWNPRIEYLAAIRNQVLEPLLQSGGYDKVLFSNDVFIEPESVIELLETRNGDYDFVCGLDFAHFGAYDMWVLRDRLGRLTSGIWPYFFDAAGYEAIKAEEPVPVFTCWNGIVVFKTDPLLPVHLRSNRTLSSSPLPSPPPTTHPWAQSASDAGSPAMTPPLAFRASTEDECYSSESFLLPYDFRRVMGLDKVYVNPRVITAYTWKWYVWHKWVLRQQLVKWFVEEVWDGAWMQYARTVVGDPKEVWTWDGGDCHPWWKH
ncbi:hypothetical protein L226DRAFT_534622 [Lentinus tigrinus ALCF2SS1-7]|uniref:Glycosyltransferase family 69 protein n=1 Tax=Lentinus tigrinus ALCF2SS1-6 TaxID=1328759 RepID=A0A5C2SCF5_9APHY|nr:hypothetical protein L227DRAFT_574589 [Lentinus tigrinus ALCF2SS1-6]RPD75032.1 hypothetical protein L226DRAFT_534622 [Lentinus tigrinus ALCF2SS1-7]